MHKRKFYSCHWFIKKKKSNIFTFSHSKNECKKKKKKKNAEICKVGNLEADIQQVPIVQFF